LQGCGLQVAGCKVAFSEAAVAHHPDATRNPQLSLGFLVRIRAYVYVPYK
jgi:hypothetical protein